MCLTYDYKATVQLRRQIKANGGTIPVYKLYNAGYEVGRSNISVSLKPPYQGGVVKLDAQGYVTSDRLSAERTEYEKFHKQIYQGIHVYTDKQVAEDSLSTGQVLLVGTASLDDLVAASAHSRHAVFHRVQFDRNKVKNALLSKKVQAAVLDEIEYETYDDDLEDAKEELAAAETEIETAKEEVENAEYEVEEAKSRLADTKSDLANSKRILAKRKAEYNKAYKAKVQRDKKVRNLPFKLA